MQIKGIMSSRVSQDNMMDEIILMIDQDSIEEMIIYSYLIRELLLCIAKIQSQREDYSFEIYSSKYSDHFVSKSSPTNITSSPLTKTILFELLCLFLVSFSVFLTEWTFVRTKSIFSSIKRRSPWNYFRFES